MKNKDRVYALLKSLTENMNIQNKTGFTANEIANRLGLKRNVVSHFLNELYKEGKVIKINTRPVFFIDKEIYEKYSKLNNKQTDNQNSFQNQVSADDPFKKLIGYNGSLKTQVKLCKSAAAYPPNGLPILLSGNTGVGKSFMAQLIFEYAKSINVINENAPYVVFNCAEYADNPELLTANLFGYVKGAFTGADKDKPGLLEEANGGYLFMDEVHRLSPEGQEKLFLFMDKGIFRRLGETGNWRTSKVRFIFATTEDPEDSLIKTFLRRIPLIVNIPSLSERPIYERIQMIYNFYKNESKSLNMDIMINKQVLNILLKAKISGNIGRLINIIKYSCAQAYTQLMVEKTKILRIHLYDLPRDILSELDNIGKENYYFNGMFVSHKQKNDCVQIDFSNDDKIRNLTKKLIDAFIDYKEKRIGIDKLKKESMECLNKIIDSIIFDNEEYKTDSVVFNTLRRVIENVLSIAENMYGVKSYGNTAIIVTNLTNRLLENLSWKYKLEDYVEDVIQIIKQIYTKDFLIAKKIIELLEINLDVRIDKLGLVFFTLYIASINPNDNINYITSLIIAHGYSTASSIASVANRLLGQFVFEAFDMPIEMPTKEIMLKVEEYLRNINTLPGVIILVDMGSLEEIYKSLANIVSGDIGIINNITTQLAIDVGNRIISGQSIEQIVKESAEKNNCRFKFIKSSKNKKNVILTTCITGIGTAQKIKDLLNQCLANENIEIIAYDFNRLKGNGVRDEVFKNYNVKLIIGTTDPGIKEIPYLSLEDLIGGHGNDVLNKALKDIIKEKTIEQVNRAIVKLFSLQNVLNNLIILNPNKIVDQVEKIICDLEINLGYNFSNELKISLYIHISCMIERLIMRNPIMNYPELKKFEQCHKQFIDAVKNSFTVIENLYTVEVPTSEIGFIYNIISTKIKHFNA